MIERYFGPEFGCKACLSLLSNCMCLHYMQTKGVYSGQIYI